MNNIMHIEHKQWTEAGVMYENVDIFAPGNRDKPIHQIDRSCRVGIVDSLEAAAESIAFGAIIADKLAKKHKGGGGVTANSNIAGAVTLALGE